MTSNLHPTRGRLQTATLAAAGVALWLGLAPAARAAGSATGAWDQSQGSTVLSTSALHPGGSAHGMFWLAGGAGKPHARWPP